MLTQNEPIDFTHTARVYYADTDAVGVVYHANYLNFMERARDEWLLSIGISREMKESGNAYFAVVSANLDFIYPARLYDLLQITCKVVKMTGVTIEFEQFVKAAENERIFCRGEIKVVCVNREVKVCRIPELWRRKIKNGC